MSLLGQLAKKQILAAQRQVDLDNLPGTGKPLQLDDDSQGPAELRASYRILKNSVYLPPELDLRREVVELGKLRRGIDSADERYQPQAKPLKLLKIKLVQACISADFLHGHYGRQLQQHFSKEDQCTV